VEEGRSLAVNSNIVLPKVERDAMALNYGRFVISPLERGFGITVGNALRRVLLSSLPGAAVTSIRVSDVPHEFSPIPGVKEDMMQLILQIKQLRMRVHDEVETARLRLEVRGEGIVTAADIICPPEVEVVNPELYLLTVGSPQTELDIEMSIGIGRGYSPADERARLPIGELPVDAIFSPVRRVRYDVEAARVQQVTNYDKLILEIWTDGTIAPEIAMREAARILMQHLSIVANIDPDTIGQEAEPVAQVEVPRPDYYDFPIEGLDLSVRVFNSLKRTGITTIGEVLEMLEKGEDAMLAIRNFGEKSLEELKDRLREKGYLPEGLEGEGEPFEE
jgi:DNA-directed RNA polymerase subunit alpha